MNTKTLFTSGLLSALLLTVAACSSDTKGNPTPSNGGSGATTGGSGSNGGATSTAATGGSTSVSTAAATGGSITVSTGTGGAACVPDTTKTCYSCPPTAPEQFLNQCSNAACQKFDNAARGVPNPVPAIGTP